jgi:hypothetical protein
MAAVIRAIRIPSRKQFHERVLREWPATESAVRTFNSGGIDVRWLFILEKRIM